VRATRSNDNGKFGIGIVIADNTATGQQSMVQQSQVMLRSSLVEDNHAIGVHVLSSEATIESTVVRGTLPEGNGEFGRGINIQNNSETRQRSHVQLRGLLIEDNHGSGVFVGGSEATIESTVVRGASPDNGTGGFGVTIQHTEERSHVQLRSSLIEDNREVGVYVWGSEVTIESTVVRGTLPDGNGAFGRGIDVQPHLETGQRSKILLRSSLVEDNRSFGVLVHGSDATIEATVVRATQPNGDGDGGDGIAVFSRLSYPASATLQGVRIEDNARAGVSFFSATVTLVSSILVCNALDLNGEVIDEGPPNIFVDGGNLCGCEVPSPSCLVSSAGLTPPTQIDPVEPLP
jgi:hypothetical protein